MYKICHVTSAHKSTDVRIFEKECTSLAKNPDYKVYLVAQGESYTRNNVRIIGAGEIPSSRKERMFEFSKKVVKKALKVDADVYHFHDPELLQYVGAFVKRAKRSSLTPTRTLPTVSLIKRICRMQCACAQERSIPLSKDLY